jgi:hypothetical protein
VLALTWLCLLDLVPVGYAAYMAMQIQMMRQPQQRRTAAVVVCLTVQDLTWIQELQLCPIETSCFIPSCCHRCRMLLLDLLLPKQRERERESYLRLSARRRCCNATPRHPAESSARGSPQRAGRYGRRPSGAGAPPHSRRCTGSGCRCCSRSRPSSRRG